jgi:hypothetical protein
MASLETIEKTRRVRERLAGMMRPYKIGSVLFDGGRVVMDWGQGEMAEDHKLHPPNLMERTYQALPRELILKFVVLSSKNPEPTATEFAMFEKKLLGTARRILKQDFEKILKELAPYRNSAQPRREQGATNRERIYREKVAKIRETVKKLERGGQKRTQAVKIAVQRLGYPERTIWRAIMSND